MAYYPTIPGYAPIFIQTQEDTTAVNILTAFGVIVKEHDIPIQRKPKDPYRNEWYDEHGDDEYIGSQLYMESFTFTETFAMLSREVDSDTSRAALAKQIEDFQDYLSKGEFSFYDDYAKRGFRKVRLSEFHAPSRGEYDSIGGKTRVIFDVTFKVNDPVTRMKLIDGEIVEA